MLAKTERCVFAHRLSPGASVPDFGITIQASVAKRIRQSPAGSVGLPARRAATSPARTRRHRAWRYPRTMERPRPEPGTLSSSRSPRSPTRARAPRGVEARPVIVDRQVANCAPAIGAARDATRLFAHLQALSIRLPAISSRSCRSPRKTEPARTVDVDRRCRAPRGCASSTRARSSSTGFTFGAIAEHIERAGGAARARDSDRPGGAWCRPGASPHRRAGPGCAAASLDSTVSGVFRKCARLETCVRARPTTSAVCSIRLLSSPASGAISAGKSSFEPARLAVADARQRLAHAAQRLQADAHLDEDRGDQARDREATNDQISVPLKSRDLGFDLAPCRRRRGTYRRGVSSGRARRGDRKLDALRQRRADAGCPGPSRIAPGHDRHRLRGSRILIVRSNSECEICGVACVRSTGVICQYQPE